MEALGCEFVYDLSTSPLLFPFYFSFPEKRLVYFVASAGSRARTYRARACARDVRVLIFATNF